MPIPLVAYVTAMAFVIQIQTAAWYARFVDTFFGRVAGEVIRTCRVPVMAVRLARDKMGAKP